MSLPPPTSPPPPVGGSLVEPSTATVAPNVLPYAVPPEKARLIDRQALRAAVGATAAFAGSFVLYGLVGYAISPTPASYRREPHSFPLIELFPLVAAVPTAIIVCLCHRTLRARGASRWPAAALLVLGTVAVLAGGFVVMNVWTDPGNPARPGGRRTSASSPSRSRRRPGTGRSARRGCSPVGGRAG